MARYLPDGSRFDEVRWKAVRKRAFNILEHKCSLCRQELDIKAPKHSRFAIEIDHVTPISRGGPPYELDNLRILCVKCNRSKGAKLDEEMQRQPEDYGLPISNRW